jgi:glycosyltransferase involved in cell wall biosynthesis
MRIAQIAPLIESVHGGTERIVSYLTEELVRQGHEVTLFASGDSKTEAELIPCSPKALRLAQVGDATPYSVLQLEKLRQRAEDFDILHFHSESLTTAEPVLASREFCRDAVIHDLAERLGAGEPPILPASVSRVEGAAP